MYNYPKAEYQPQEVAYGKHVVIDGYEWMRDAKSSATKTFTEQENSYNDNYFMNHNEIFDKYFEEHR